MMALQIVVKIIQILPRIITTSSGPSYSVPRLCGALADYGAEVELHLVGQEPKSIHPGVKVRAYPPDRITSIACGSRAMREGLRAAVASADILHNHSLWLLPNVYAGQVANLNKHCKIVVSPRGTLTEWAMRRSRWRKRAMWWAGQRRTCESAAMMHATSESERQDIRRMGFQQPVAVLPNGVDLANHEDKQDRENTILFLSRIHPKKGIDRLLQVWKSLERKFPDWNLVVAGPLNGVFPQQMQEMARTLGLNRVEFPGELTGDCKVSAYRKSRLFVLPTESENFGLVVAEALAEKLPVIVTKGAPWEGVVDHNCGWWIENTNEALAFQLEEAMSLPIETLLEMGENGARWVREEYDWGKIGHKFIKAYQWLHSGGRPPEWIQTD